MDKPVFIRGNIDESGKMLVTYTHFFPLSETDGLTEDEMKDGILTYADYPDMSVSGNEVKELYYDRETDTFSVIVRNPVIPLSDSEKLDLIMQSMLESEGIL